MKKIIQNIINKKITKQNETKNTFGFWMKTMFGTVIPTKERKFIYNNYWAIYKETAKQILEDQNKKLAKVNCNYPANEIIRENLDFIDEL